MTAELLARLRPGIAGDVRGDAYYRNAYSMDASMYQIQPVAVVLPRTVDDIRHALVVAAEFDLTIIPRGAGTGTTGGCIGQGLIIDCSRYLNRIGDIDAHQHRVRCEPGVVLDQLNDALHPRGFRFGPDTSTSNRATLGGMFGNNASGAHSIRYGTMIDHVVGGSLMLADGTSIDLGTPVMDRAATMARTGSDALYSNVALFAADMRRHLAEEIKRRYPQIHRRVSGYNLNELVRAEPVSLARLVCGSEGTFGIVTSLELDFGPEPEGINLLLFSVSDLVEGLALVPKIMEFGPSAVEMIDRRIIKAGRRNPFLNQRLAWLDGDPDGLLMVEFDSLCKPGMQSECTRHLTEVARKTGAVLSVLREAVDIGNAWALRKLGLGLLMSQRVNERALPFLEDVAVPPTHLAAFIRAFRAYIRGKGKDAGMYGHAGAGCIHVRPMMDLAQSSDVELMVEMMHDVSSLALEYGGAVSGEHGDGLVRSWLNRKMFGDEIFDAFVRLKAIFDPNGRMNPGKIVSDQGPDSNLRSSLTARVKEPDTFLDFSQSGGFAFSVGMCNSNGECRKISRGVMCPSYQATRDEVHSTRGRAQSILAALSAGGNYGKLADAELHGILDLCLECKGCKHECPSHVDMAKMKSEFLYHYQRATGVPIRSSLVSSIDRLSALCAHAAPLSNWLSRGRCAARIRRAVGFTDRREYPTFHRRTFTRLYDAMPPPASANSGTPVVLFVDTFTQFNQPALGLAAVDVLLALGHNIIIPGVRCCGRPALSKGLLPAARRRALCVIDMLYPFAQRGYPIVGLEPSCILTIRDDYADLTNDTRATVVAAASHTIERYLADIMVRGSVPVKKRGTTPILYHAHCHQRAVEGGADVLTLLRTVNDAAVNDTGAGCCGMAGSFGYEVEHYDLSMKIANQRLFPALRGCDEGTRIVASGMSCRQQIRDGMHLHAQHPIEVIADCLPDSHRLRTG